MSAQRPGALTFVTVVFEPEIALLRLQARSLARFLDPDCVESIIVLDNCAGGMRASTRRSLTAAFGTVLAPRVTILRTSELGVQGSTEGWRSQQAAKLLISMQIETQHYVILDAKNHLIAPIGCDSFVTADGHARGGTHPYTEHPLRKDLERTLRYLGADDDEVARRVANFPQTTTPYVIETALAQRIIRDVETTAGEPFPDTFERAQLLEFFLYAGWSIEREQRVPVDGGAIAAPIIWPGKADLQGAEAAIREAESADAAWFSVHRRVLARSDAATRSRIIDFWVVRNVMTAREASRFVRRFRRSYVPAVARARIAERLLRVRGR